MQRLLQDIPEEATLALHVFRPRHGTTHTYRVVKTAVPQGFLRQLPATVYVTTVLQGGAGEQAGLQPGDVILQMNGQSLTPRPESDPIDPIAWVLAVVSPLFGQPVTHALVAEHIILRAGVGQTLAYEVLRDNLPLTLQVTLTTFGLPTRSVILGFLVVFICMAGGIVRMMRPRRTLLDSFRGGFGIALFEFGFIVTVVIIRKDAAYDSFAMWRDILLGITIWGFLTPTPSGPRTGHQLLHFRQVVYLTTVLLWLLYVWHLHSPLPADIGTALGYDSFASLRVKLFHRGAIPPMICWTFLFGLLYLLLIWGQQLAPLSPRHEHNSAIYQAARAGDLDAMLAVVNAQTTSGQFGYYSQRVYQLISHLNRDPERTALLRMHNDLLAQDEDNASRAFVPVTWCEAALPLLGFLGTIVGMGGAIGALAPAIQAIYNNIPDVDILKHFTIAFQGMGEAFDTTFWGLAGVLLLSMADRTLKKRIAARLADARALLDRVIEQWSASSVAGELGEVNLRLHGVAAELDRSRAFRETVRALVERVITEVPGYEGIRDALFEPVVVFERVFEGLDTALIPPIEAALGQAAWHFVCLGLPVSAVSGGVIAIRQGQGQGGDGLLWFEPHKGPTGAVLQTPHRFTQLLPTRDLQTVLGRTLDGQLRLLTRPHAGAGPVEPTSVLKNGDLLDDQDDAVFQIAVEQQDIAVLVRKTGEQAYDVFWRVIHPDAPPGLQHLGALPPGFVWSKWSVHGPSAMLLVAGCAGDCWRLLRLPIQKRATSAGSAIPLELVADFNRFWVELPSGVVPHHVVALPHEALLVLDTQGTLHYWHPTRRLRPVRPHPQWVINQNNAASCQIRSGRENWIAVVANAQLSMWWVSRSRALAPYVDDAVPPHLVTFPGVDTAAQQMLQATADGHYLLTVRGQELATWAFPRYTIDDFTGNEGESQWPGSSSMLGPRVPSRPSSTS